VAPRGSEAVKVKIIGGSIAGVLLASAALIAPWEGYSAKPYKDLVGVVTVCFGSTHNVQQRTYSREECEAILRTDIGRHLNGVAQCIQHPLKENEWVAVTSWTFNVGINAACGSTLVRKINAGQPASVWCGELLRWNRAGGKVVRGLTNRRKAEYAICVGDK
jgi:lysozyme